METEFIKRACAAVGGQSALAKILGLTTGAVSQWVNGHRPIPVEHGPAIERATSGEVSCEELRPDVTWFRIKDRAWPHPEGRPLVDHAKKAA